MGVLDYKKDFTAQDELPAFLKALAQRESGGQKDPYKAIGKKTKSGDVAYGKYQIMGSNIPSWTKQYLGKEMSPQEFMNDPQAQDQLMTKRALELYAKHGNWNDVASIHFTGQTAAVAGSEVKDVNGTTNGSYIQDVIGAFNQFLGGGTASAAEVGPGDTPIQSDQSKNTLTPTLTQAQLKQNIDALQKGGMTNDKVQAYVDNYSKAADGSYALKTSGGAPATPASSSSGAPKPISFDMTTGQANGVGDAGAPASAASADPGFWKGLVQNLANPFLRTGVTLAQGGAQAAADVGVKGAQDIANTIRDSPTSFGNLGEATPVGVKQASQGNYPAAAADFVGTAANLALYAIAPEVGGAEGAVGKGVAEQGAKGIIKTAAKKVVSAATGKGALKMGAAAAVSTAGQEAGAGKSPLGAAVDGLISGGAFLAGNGVLSLMGLPTGYFGSMFMKSDAMKYVTNSAKEFGSSLMKLFPEGSDNLAVLGTNATRAAQATAYLYDKNKIAMVNAGYEQIVGNRQVDETAFRTIVPAGTWEQFNSEGAKKTAQFSAVYNSGEKWMPATAKDVIASAQEDTAKLAGINMEAPEGTPPAAAELYKLQAQAAAQGSQKGATFPQWLAQVKSGLFDASGNAKPTDISAVDTFLRHQPTTANASQDRWVTKIVSAIVTDAKTSLKENGKGDLADKLDQAFADHRAFTKDLKNGALKVLTSLSNPKEDIAALVTGVKSKLGTPEAVDRVFKYLGGTKGKVEGAWSGGHISDFRQLVMNVAASKIKAGISVEPLLKSANETGLLSPVQVSALGEFQMLGQQDFEKWLTEVAPRIGVDAEGMKSALGFTPEEVSAMSGQKAAAKTSAELAQQIRSGQFDAAAATLEKTKVASKVEGLTAGLAPADKYKVGAQITSNAIKDVQLAKPNADGTYDITKMLKALNTLRDKANGAQASLFPDSFREGIDKILQNTEFKDALDNPGIVKKSKFEAITRAIVGIYALSHGRLSFGGYQVVRGAQAAGRGGTSQVTEEELVNEITKSGKIPLNMISQIDKALFRGKLPKLLAGKAGQTVQQEVAPGDLVQ